MQRGSELENYNGINISKQFNSYTTAVLCTNMHSIKTITRLEKCWDWGNIAPKIEYIGQKISIFY